MFHCRTHTWDGDERERREEIGWQREGEENFIPSDKDIFNPLSLHCRTHAWDGDERVTRRGDDPYDENGGSTLMQFLCVHLD